MVVRHWWGRNNGDDWRIGLSGKKKDDKMHQYTFLCSICLYKAITNAFANKLTDVMSSRGGPADAHSAASITSVALLHATKIRFYNEEKQYAQMNTVTSRNVCAASLLLIYFL